MFGKSNQKHARNTKNKKNYKKNEKRLADQIAYFDRVNAKMGKFIDSIEVNGDLARPLLLFCDEKIEKQIYDGQKVIYFAKNSYFQTGVITPESNTVIFIDEGKILEEAPPEEFFGNPKNPRLKDFLSKVL